MNTEEKIIQMLEESHRRGHDESFNETAALVSRLHRRRWRRRAKRMANSMSAAIVAAAVVMALTWIPVSECSSYKTSQAGGSPLADCQLIHQMLNHA